MIRQTHVLDPTDWRLGDTSVSMGAGRVDKGLPVDGAGRAVWEDEGRDSEGCSDPRILGSQVGALVGGR